MRFHRCGGPAWPFSKTMAERLMINPTPTIQKASE